MKQKIKGNVHWIKPVEVHEKCFDIPIQGVLLHDKAICIVALLRNGLRWHKSVALLHQSKTNAAVPQPLRLNLHVTIIFFKPLKPHKKDKVELKLFKLSQRRF